MSIGGYGDYYYGFNPYSFKNNDNKDNNGIGKSENVNKAGEECQTCKNRKYQDESSDSGVSMQTPTKLSPQAAESAVRTHEQQHVSRNQAEADRNGREVVSQNVTIKREICPECGKSVIAGGETRTVTKTKSDNKIPQNLAPSKIAPNNMTKDNPYSVGLFGGDKGKLFDAAA